MLIVIVDYLEYCARYKEVITMWGQFILWSAVGLKAFHVQEALYVLPEYKLAMCVPSKNGCALAAGVLSELNPKFDGPFWISSFPGVFNITDVQKTIYESPEWTKVMIVRDPVERIKSAWRSKCTDSKERNDARCKTIFRTKAPLLNDAAESLLTVPPEKRDRHVHHQVDFCFNISSYVQSGAVQVFQHSSSLVTRTMHKILRSVGVEEERLEKAFDGANRIISRKYGNHVTQTSQALLSESLREQIIRDYQVDIDTFKILPQLPIDVLVPAMNQFDIVKQNLESLWRHYFVDVYIADDGPEDLTKVYADYCYYRPCHYVYVGFDRGLSFKRNRLSELAQRDTVFFCDADTMWTEQSNLVAASKILAQGASIVGFTFPNVKFFYGSLWKDKDGGLRLCNKEKMEWDDYDLGCFRNDVSPNLFLTSRQLVLNHPWNESLKVRCTAVRVVLGSPFPADV